MVKLVGGQVLLRAAALGIMLAASGARSASVTDARITEPNTLTEEERNAGWKLLFNGRNLDGWQLSQSDLSAPPGWAVLENSIANDLTASSTIVSKEIYGSFELTMDWKVGKGGNGGLYYRVWREDADLQRVSPQAQVIDNDANIYGTDPNTWAGACTWLYPPEKDMTKPVGEFNQLRILVANYHIEHWMNGVKVVEYDIGSADWKARLTRSPLKDYPDLGARAWGRIGLQHLTTTVRFRNIKIRPTSPPQGVLTRNGAGRPYQGRRTWAHVSGASRNGEMIGLSILDLQGRALSGFRPGRGGSPADQIIFTRAAGE